MTNKRRKSGTHKGGRRPVTLVTDPDTGEDIDNLRFHKPTGRYYRIEADKRTRYYYPKRSLKNLAYLRRAVYEHRLHLEGLDPDHADSVELERRSPTFDDFGEEVSAYQPTTHLNRNDVALYVRDQLLNPETRSGFAALVGIPELAYLHRLRPADDSATLESLISTYLRDKRGQTKREGRKYWDEFVSMIAVEKVSEITPDHVREYANAVHLVGKSSSYVGNRFGVVRAVLRNALRNHVDNENVSRVIQYLPMLRAPRRQVRPDLEIVPRVAFDDLLRHADARMKAVLLLSLNAALLPVDLIRIRQDAIDWTTGHMRDIRTKTGIPRIAVLWSRTLEALRQYLEESNHQQSEVFVGDTGRPLALANQITKRFKRLRKSAGVPDSVKFAHLRKSAETAAIEGGADSLHVDMLLGHRAAGVKDHYLLRKPTMVRDACEAIERYYFGE